MERAQQRLAQACAAQGQVDQQLQLWQQLSDLEALYRAKEKPERPHSQLAQVRQRVAVYAQRQERRARALAQATQGLAKAQARLEQQQCAIEHLAQRLATFKQENTINLAPIRAVFRLDAGFGTPENVAWLIELGYEVYTKPYGPWLKADLLRQTNATTHWTRVGKNAEMVA